MRAKEFVIKEGAADPKGDGTLLHKEQQAAIRGMVSMPDISMNKSNGSFYQQMRFFLAMAGVGGAEPGVETPVGNAFAGDPVMAPYSSKDLAIIKQAAKMVGAGRIVPMVSDTSDETNDTYTVSPVADWNPRNRKKEKDLE